MRRVLNSSIVILAFLLLGSAYGQQVESTKDRGDPTATILGSDTEVCLGDSVEAYLFFTGNGPWDATIRDKDGVYLKVVDVGTPHSIWLKPVKDNRYYISRVEDNSNHTGKTNGEVEVSVFEINPVSFLLERTAYLQTEAI